MTRRLLAAMLFLLYMAMTAFSPVAVSAYGQEIVEDGSSDGDDAKPVKYHSSLILQSVGEINREDGHFWAQFIIVVESDDVDFQKNPPELIFINARNANSYDAYVSPHYYETTVEAEFFTEMDFHDHPFESIPLKIMVEPKMPGVSSEIVFVPKDHPISHSGVSVPGWDIANPTLISENYMYPDDLEFSRLVATFHVEREPLGIALRTLFPISIITAVSLIIFFIPENFTSRIYLTAPLLLSLVYLHQANLEHIPPLDYLSIFDKIMLIYYAIFVNSIVALGVQMKIHSCNGDSGARIKKYNRIHLCMVPVILVAGVLILWNL